MCGRVGMCMHTCINIFRLEDIINVVSITKLLVLLKNYKYLIELHIFLTTKVHRTTKSRLNA